MTTLLAHVAMARMTGSREARRARDKALGPTLERQAKGDIIAEEETAKAGVKRKRVETQTMLDRYHHRGQISKAQYDAGCRLHARFAATGGYANIVGSYDIRIQSGAPGTLPRQVEAYERVAKALRYVGRQLSPILITVCLRDTSARDWAVQQDDNPESGLVVLRLALDRLAEYYQKSKT